MITIAELRAMIDFQFSASVQKKEISNPRTDNLYMIMRLKAQLSLQMLQSHKTLKHPSNPSEPTEEDINFCQNALREGIKQHLHAYLDEVRNSGMQMDVLREAEFIAFLAKAKEEFLKSKFVQSDLAAQIESVLKQSWDELKLKVQITESKVSAEEDEVAVGPDSEHYVSVEGVYFNASIYKASSATQSRICSSTDVPNAGMQQIRERRVQ